MNESSAAHPGHLAERGIRPGHLQLGADRRPGLGRAALEVVRRLGLRCLDRPFPFPRNPASTLSTGCSQPGPTPPEAFAEAFDRWMDYYERNRIEAVDAGFINLRRRTGGRNWVRIDRDRNPDPYARGGDPAGIRRRRPGRADQDDDGEDLLAMKLRCRPDLTFSQRLRPSESGWAVARTECTLDNGLRFEGDCNPAVFHLLTLCRGDLPVSGVLGADSRSTGPGRGRDPAGMPRHRPEPDDSRVPIGLPTGRWNRGMSEIQARGRRHEPRARDASAHRGDYRLRRCRVPAVPIH